MLYNVLFAELLQGGPLCQKSKSSWFSDIFPFLWTQECQQVKNFQKFLISSVGASRLQFYFMIYFIVVLVRSLELKKSMKELEQPFNFFWRTYQDFLDFPKKFWGLGPSPHIGTHYVMNHPKLHSTQHKKICNILYNFQVLCHLLLIVMYPIYVSIELLKCFVHLKWTYHD